MGFLSSLFGVKDRTPATNQVVQSAKLPPEIAPFVKEIAGEARDLYRGEIERGYDPYTGQMIAELTPEEQQAMTGIAGLAGATRPFLEEAMTTFRTGAEKFTPETAQEYMSPYQRAVTDIEKREAERAFEKQDQAREARAVEAGAGSMMGSRAAIEAAEAARNQQQLLGDIEARGLQRAFENAQQQFGAQKARERTMASDVARTGTALTQADIAGLGALQTVGEQKRALGQSALDEAYGKFLEERNFPQQTLADYSSTIYGNPFARTPSFNRTGSNLPGAPSMGQQLLGLGLTGLNIYGAGTKGGTQGFNLGAAGKGMLGLAGGGRLSGLSGLPVIRRQVSGPVDDTRTLEDLLAIDQEESAPLINIPKLNEYVDSPSKRESLIQNPDLDPEKVKASEEKDISALQNLFSGFSTGEKKLSDDYFKRKKELLQAEEYPFANIQSAIAAGMESPTIAMGIIQGMAKAGELTKDEKKELKKAEIEMLGEEFGVEKEQLAKKERRALNIFERNSSLRKRLLSLPSELRTKVLNEINALKGIQVKDATIAKLLAEAEEELKGDTKGQNRGYTGKDLPDLLGQIINPTTNTPFLSAKKEDRTPAGAAALAEASKIIGEVLAALPSGTRPGTIIDEQEKALRGLAGRTRIANAMKAAGTNTNINTNTNTNKSSASSIIKNQGARFQQQGATQGSQPSGS